MTIGELIKAKMFKARAIAFGFWLIAATGMFLPTSGIYKSLLFIPFIGFACSVLYILFFVKCPKCDARLGQVMSSIGKAKFCPGCGVSFDSRA